MTKAFIANCTPQNHVANFRLPDVKKPIELHIGAGRQVQVPGGDDLSPPAIDAMVNQLGRYGMVHVDEAGKSREKITFLYSTGTPVPAEAIRRVLDRNRGILREEGKDRRLKSAIAANDSMNTAETPINNFESSIEEVESGGLGHDSENIGEGVKIDNLQAENAPKKGRGKKGK